MKPLKLYWSSGLKNGRKNFGDWLSPLLVRELSGRDVEYAVPEHCDLVAVGSILQRLKHHWWNRQIYVWGTGFIEAGVPVRARHFYHALRGKETAARLKDVDVAALGDPGLLVDRLLPNYRAISKECRIGIVPHYKDKLSSAVSAFEARTPYTKILDILSEPDQFLRKIAGCEFVLSSSLHGLVIADAFRIPNAWIELSEAVRGAQFKFRDYYSVFGIDSPAPLRLESLHSADIDRLAALYARPNLAQIQDDLLRSFPYAF